MTKPLHNKTTFQAIEVCAVVGAKFWSLAPKGYLYGTRDGQFIRVKRIRQRAIVEATPVDSLGRAVGATVEHPDPAGC